MISNQDFVLLVDKPIGISSRDTSGIIKRHFKLSKVGHLGTLDMEASGLLVILSGKCTKFERYLHALPKTYVGEISLGDKTISDDIFSEVIESALVPLITSESIASLKDKYTGTYLQTPPQVSAKKVGGKVAYKEARLGREVELLPKQVSCNINYLEEVSDTVLGYSVTSSSGFYVRSLARDIGEALGTFGAAKSIRRTAIGQFEVEKAVKIIEGKIQENNLDIATHDLIATSHIVDLPSIELEDEGVVAKLRNGNKSTLITLLEGKEEYRAKVYFEGEIISVVSKFGGEISYEVNF